MIRAIALTVPLALLLAGPASAAPDPDPRILVDATVNGKPVKLWFDTGCDLGLVLFRETVERLGIREGKDSKVKVSLGIPGIGEATGTSRVLDLAGLARGDGILGWRCVGAPVLRLDTVGLSVTYLQELPEGVEKWDAYALSSADVVLCTLCPGEGGRLEKVFFDTGMEGALLSRSRWKALHRECPGLPATLTGGYSPAAGGTFVSKVTLAPTLSFGRLKLDRLIVQESAFVSEQFAGHAAVLGLRALMRFEILIDVRGSKVYLRPREGPFEVPDYNRMGAVFVPKTLEDDDLVAHVLPGSPAARAGLRSGDVLLAVNGRDYSNWRKTPKLLTRDRAAEQPAGTRHVFAVRRGGKRLEVAVTLEEILAVPEVDGAEK